MAPGDAGIDVEERLADRLGEREVALEAALRELVGPADQLLVPLLYPDVDVWAMEPFTLEIRTE